MQPRDVDGKDGPFFLFFFVFFPHPRKTDCRVTVESLTRVPRARIQLKQRGREGKIEGGKNDKTNDARRNNRSGCSVAVQGRTASPGRKEFCWLS